MAISEDGGTGWGDRRHDGDSVTNTDGPSSNARGEIPFGGSTGSLAGLDGGGLATEAAAHLTAEPGARASSDDAMGKDRNMNPEDDQTTREGQRADVEQPSAGRENRETGATAPDDVAGEPFAPDAGSPGGMGGARSSGGSGTGRPPGGVSPVQDD